MNRRLRAIISGRVQGVFYRATTEKKARELGLAGQVKNLPDGNVELIAEGPEESLKQLLEWCRKGPPLARVTNLDATWGEATGEFTRFSTS